MLILKNKCLTAYFFVFVLVLSNWAGCLKKFTVKFEKY